MHGIKHEKGVVERPNTARGEAECCIAARDHGLRVLYSAGTACTKRAITNLLYFERAQVERRLTYHFDCPFSGSDRLTRWKKRQEASYQLIYSEYYTLNRAYCPYLARTVKETALCSVL